jgi:hypothetical protein
MIHQKAPLKPRIFEFLYPPVEPAVRWPLTVESGSAAAILRLPEDYYKIVTMPRWE